jgi:hypothetical protein
MTKKTRTNKSPLLLMSGFLATAAAAAILYTAPAFGPRHLLTGVAAGGGVAYLAFMLYFLLLPRPEGEKISFVKSYLPGAAARYVVLIGAFCAMIFWLKIDPVGVLLGAFAGMMAATFVALVKMRRAANRSPGV